jgi:molecular chaperone DnaK (HSP70)
LPIYGIDLGTTNSLIGVMDGGRARILSGLFPSVVNVYTKEAGPEMKRELRASGSDAILSSFKVDIREQYAINASSLVLKSLLRYAPGARDAVISVPAYFDVRQRENTIQAAKNIGLNVAALINEPTAAALYYNRSAKNVSLVYDLGGGTFDVSIIEGRFGRHDVQVTDGIRLGGDDLNRALLTVLLKEHGLPLHYFSASDIRKLREEVEHAKIRLQADRRDVQFEAMGHSFVLKVETYKNTVRFVFGKTIARTQNVVSGSGYEMAGLALVFVGGSTRDPYLREMVCTALGKENEPVTYNPDEIVAQGAVYYAHLIETGQAEKAVSDVTKAIGFRLRNGTVQTLIEPNTMLPVTGSTHLIFNEVEDSGISIELYQGDSILAEDCDFIGRLDYAFGRALRPREGILSLQCDMDRSGVLTLSAHEIGKPPETIRLRVT